MLFLFIIIIIIEFDSFVWSERQKKGDISYFYSEILLSYSYCQNASSRIAETLNTLHSKYWCLKEKCALQALRANLCTTTQSEVCAAIIIQSPAGVWEVCAIGESSEAYILDGPGCESWLHSLVTVLSQATCLTLRASASSAVEAS